MRPLPNPQMGKKCKAVFAKLKVPRRGNSTKAKMAVAVACVHEPVDIDAQLDAITDGVDDIHINALPNLPIAPSGNFDFCPPVSSPEWPGPRYDDLSSIVPGIFNRSRDMMLSRTKTKTKQKRTAMKRSTSHDDRNGVRRPSRKATKSTAMAMTKQTTPRRPQYCQSPPAREEPLHLLNLPGEIRNQIYRYLYVWKEPLHAKYRPIIKPHKGTVEPAVKRFPREPALALVCKQLRREATSLFYAENTFIFASSAGAQSSRAQSMTKPTNLDRWMMASTLTSSLTHIELRLGDRNSMNASIREAVKYIFRGLPDGSLDIQMDPMTWRCTCFDRNFYEEVREDLCEVGPGLLLGVAVSLVDRRESAIQRTPLGTSRGECAECGKLDWVERGWAID